MIIYPSPLMHGASAIPPAAPIRSLRAARISRLRVVLAEASNLGHETIIESPTGRHTEARSAWAPAEYAAWQSAPTWESRACYHAAAASAMRAEIARLTSLDDDVYDAERRERALPLTTGTDLTEAEILFYASRMGIERRYYHERFRDFGDVYAGMRGFSWVWAASGETVSCEDQDRCLGPHFQVSIQDPLLP